MAKSVLQRFLEDQGFPCFPWKPEDPCLCCYVSSLAFRRLFQKVHKEPSTLLKLYAPDWDQLFSEWSGYDLRGPELHFRGVLYFEEPFEKVVEERIALTELDIGCLEGSGYNDHRAFLGGADKALEVAGNLLRKGLDVSVRHKTYGFEILVCKET